MKIKPTFQIKNVSHKIVAIAPESALSVVLEMLRPHLEPPPYSGATENLIRAVSLLQRGALSRLLATLTMADKLQISLETAEAMIAGPRDTSPPTQRKYTLQTVSS